MTARGAGAARLALLAAALVVLPAGAAAGDAPPISPTSASDVPSVAVVPADTAPDDPNGGQWFVTSLIPGTSASLRARVGNPASVAQRVEFSVQDLVFADDGTASIDDDRSVGVAAWGRAPAPMVLPAGKEATVTFQVRVPAGAEPGDHVGALVATTANQQGGFRVVRRVATRLYVTVPGGALPSFDIAGLRTAVVGAAFPKAVQVDVRLRNDGGIRIQPSVRVGDRVAGGPDLLMSRSVESYAARVDVPWYGGLIRIPVRVEGAGISRTAERTVLVVPWGLVAITLLLLVGGGVARFAVRSRRRRPI